MIEKFRGPDYIMHRKSASKGKAFARNGRAAPVCRLASNKESTCKPWGSERIFVFFTKLCRRESRGLAEIGREVSVAAEADFFGDDGKGKVGVE